MLNGLPRGTVRLMAHHYEWDEEAKRTIEDLRHILGNAAIDIQHIGSTAIPSICAKPIIDIVIGVEKVAVIARYAQPLENNGYIIRGEDVQEQLLLVKGDFEQDTRTHHIHVVKWNGEAWNNYINLRDYLNAFPEKAAAYGGLKQQLAIRFPQDRMQYTNGKQSMINELLEEAKLWRAQQSCHA
ncbi:GrpB family protein [Bifidobacterium oedipodis]|uniref:GrpB protein n=1 Tax=Bifidobacterium oedipodis TaxID=2675322 RepID=A0A7Y0EN32_9BIFI|nr:GrpB family protein [Bifidobacterium sp. DSM 109957]NMM93202.1 GrpB protein [Bifidobacterium sp. DSM 109957]